jgi:hypothetical protein
VEFNSPARRISKASSEITPCHNSLPKRSAPFFLEGSGLRAKANSRRARLELTAAPPAARREFRGILIGIAATYLLGFGAEPISTMDDQVMPAAAMYFFHTGKLTVPNRFAEATPGRAFFGRTTAAGEVYAK